MATKISTAVFISLIDAYVVKIADKSSDKIVVEE